MRRGRSWPAGIGRLWFAMAFGPIFTPVALVSRLLGAVPAAATIVVLCICAMPVSLLLALYAQSYHQLLSVYRKADVDPIIGNARSQVYYSPTDVDTGRLISEQHGTRLEISPSVTGGFITGNDARIGQSTRYVPTLEPTALIALAPDKVVVITQGLRTLADRLDPRALFDSLPAYHPAAGPRAPAMDLEAEARLATKEYRSNNGRGRGLEQGAERLW